jgi:hypothetical protein
MAVGRITGPLLKANLLRQGVDLAFETDLIYLKVTDLDSANHRVGIKTDSPSHDLHVNGTSRTTSLIVDTLADFANISISGTNISTTQNVLTLTPGGISPVVYQARLRVDNIDLENNVISTNSTDTNLELRPNGAGTVEVFSNLTVNGSIHATGNISSDGNIQLGNASTDNITFSAEVASDIIPDADNTYRLGSNPALGGKQWAGVWANNLYADSIDTGNIVVDNINLNSIQGNIIYVAANGSDSYSGTHQNDPYATIKYALSQSVPGDTVYIYPGTYVEIFPLTIPSGVSIRGSGIRSVTIKPTAGTNTNDAVLLNGEVTIEDVTIADFFSPGYAFKFSPGFTVTSRSPYIKNVSILTKGSVTSVSDTLGFDAADAGRGAFLDGAVVSVSSKEAACLFHSVTFITPGVDAIVTTNGTRIEWLNCFTYYADRGFYAYSSTAGVAGAGKTALRLTGNSGTFTTGNTLSYYDTDGITLLASGTISSVDANGKIYLTGNVAGLETAASLDGKTITAFGSAQLSTSVKQFGTASLSLDGSTAYAKVASSTDFAFGTADFTLEAWIYRDVTAGAQTLFDFRPAATSNAPWLYFNGSNLVYYVAGAARITGTAVAGTIDTWYHIAVSRSGTDTKLFVDGVQVGSTWTDTTNYIQGGLFIGASYTGASGFLDGYIDDVRISKAVARYTANFAVPTGQVANDIYVSLLSYFNGDDTSTAFVGETVLPQDIRSSVGGTATGFTLVDYSDFGTEIRAIGSAAVYGNYGFVGDGAGVVAYLIGHNLAYIGVGKRSDNDISFVIQVNEVVQTNNANIYYSTVDHKGDFRVGDLFRVDQDTGTVDFTTTNFNINSLNGVTFSDGVNTTYVDGTRIETGNLQLSGNTLESLSGDVNIVSASDIINLQNDVNIAGNLDVIGNVTIGGNIILGDAATDTINFVAGISSNIVPRITDTYSLGTSPLQWANVFAGELHVDAININGNTISTTTTNTNLILTANGSGIISIPSNNVEITNTLTVNGLTTLANTTIVGTITHTGAVNQTGNVVITGNTGITGNLTVGDYAQFTNVRIETNVVSTTIADSDLTLVANGTGRVYVPSNDVQLDQNLTVVGTTATATINNTGTITSDNFFDGNIKISGNIIETTLANTDLNLVANGVGVINIEQFKFSSNIISSSTASDIVIQPGTGKVVSINSTQSIVIPVGTTGQRPTGVAGMMRFNTSLSRYEGFDGADWIRLDSRVTDLDENTYITAELTPGANDNIIRFYNNAVLTATLDSTKLTVPRVEVDNIIIDGDTISSSALNTNLNFVATGTGSVVIENFAFKDNTITNTVSGSITTIAHTGTGYFKIDGTNGFVIPTGISSERPAYAVLGMTRYNSEVKQLEIFNGVSWDSAAGAGGGINAATAEDIAITYALILG